MKRAVNCLNAQILHIYFEDDSLVFDLAKSKGPQYGKMYLGPWHVYENPNKPWICTFLSLSIYLMTYPYTLVGKRSLFEGQDQYSRYTNISPESSQSTGQNWKLLVWRNVIWELIVPEKVLPWWKQVNVLCLLQLSNLHSSWLGNGMCKG